MGADRVPMSRGRTTALLQVGHTPVNSRWVGTGHRCGLLAGSPRGWGCNHVVWAGRAVLRCVQGAVLWALPCRLQAAQCAGGNCW
jgi:hypothetical protein